MGKKRWLGILAIMLVFGLTVIGCDKDDNGKGGGEAKLTVINQYSNPITRIVTGRVHADGPQHALDENVNITTSNSQTFSLGEVHPLGHSLPVWLHAEGLLHHGNYTNYVLNNAFLRNGQTTTVRLTSDGNWVSP